MSLAAQDAENPILPGRATEPRMRGESLYDRVTSGLIASVTGASLVFGWLAIIWMAQEAYAGRVTAPIVVVEVFDGGGTLDGGQGPAGDIAVPAAPIADGPSSNGPDPLDTIAEPAVTEQFGAPVSDLPGEMEGVDTEEPDAGAIGVDPSGPRRRRIVEGGPGIGNGPGGGGVRPEDRWSVIYPPGQTIDEYARQLDSLGIELGTISGNALEIASNFTASSPAKRVVSNATTEKRLYFLWQGGTRKGNDIELLKKAGITVGNAPVFQFYPKEVEEVLRQLEVRYQGRQPIQIRSTKFLVVPAGGKYGFKVTSQEPLR